jgi:transcriptional regulator GlxA family with amidase domain
VTCFNGMLITPHATFQNAPQLDYLLIPGGFGTRKEAENIPLNEFVKKQAQTCRIVLSVCTGSFILHSAGLLNGKKATTHYLSLDRLRDLGDIDVVEERYVKNDKVWTSSGVSAGIDMTLDLIAQEAGEEAAGQVQLYAEYFPNGKVYGTPQNDPNAPGYIQAIR